MRKIIFIILVVQILFSACEDVLDKRDFSAVDETLWNDETRATMYLNKLYADNMPGMSLAGNAGYGDETFNSNDYVYGQLIESSVGDFSLLNYRKIRDINIMLEGIENGTLENGSRDILMGQACFLRAWRYWELVKLYGGVPLIMEAQDPFYDNLNSPRNKTSECIDAIISDLDKGIENLPGKWIKPEDYGRITCGAAAAMKGRVLLFWASPQFNPEYKPERWQRAYEANAAARELLEGEGYGLVNDFSQIFLIEGYDNPEAILIRSYDDAYFPGGWESSCRPPSGGGTGSNNPTLELVNAFPMLNGKSITDPTSGYDEIYYWRNRDPRFYATVAYNGCEWKLNGRNAAIQWTYYLNSQENRRTPSTGFYCRKASNPNVHVDDVERTPTDWIEIRFAEVLLNLAECTNEIGNSTEAYDILKQIRARAGIEPGANNMYGLNENMDKTEMREAIIRERQIELAYENKRYWDLRRHMMFANDLGPGTPKLNGTVRHGIIVRAKSPYSSSDIDAMRDTIDIETDYETCFTVQLKNMDTQYTINYLQPKYNFFAIPQNILDRSPAVEQTMGWENGTFDPYAE
jgi:hypothetical protein